MREGNAGWEGRKPEKITKDPGSLTSSDSNDSSSMAPAAANSDPQRGAHAGDVAFARASQRWGAAQWAAAPDARRRRLPAICVNDWFAEELLLLDEAAESRPVGKKEER